METVPTQRLGFVDALRGLAVVWMIETHVVHICLSSIWKTGWWYWLVNLSNGYVAVAFVFCAGAGFWMAIEKKGTINFLRVGFVLMVGYWLNLPSMSLHKTLQDLPHMLPLIARCDVLHAIAFSYFISFLFIFSFRRIRRSYFLFGILTLAVFFTSPLVQGLSLPLPVFFSSLFSPESKFPLFPWMGYFFAGIFFMGLVSRSENKKKVMIWLAVLSILIPWFLYHQPWILSHIPHWNDLGHASPGHALFRLGGVVFLFALFYFLPPFSFLKNIGQESLFFYVLHLLIVYGGGVSYGLYAFIPNLATPLQAFLITLSVTAVCATLAHMWHAYKISSPRQARQVITALVVLFGIVYSLTP